MTWVAAAIGGSAILNLYSANKTASAATNAANLQAQAAQQASALQQQNFNTINQEQAPQRAAGYGALNQLEIGRASCRERV